VDVVEARVNELGPYPLLLRLGKEEHHARIAQHLTSWLAETSSADAAARYEWLVRAHQQDGARFTAVQREIASVVSWRNAVDNLERAAEPARALFGEKSFSELRAADVEAMGRHLEPLAAALDAAERPSQAMARLLRETGRSRRAPRPENPISKCGGSSGTGWPSGWNGHSGCAVTGKLWSGCARPGRWSNWRAI
jgi:hypothetical protein